MPQAPIGKIKKEPTPWHLRIAVAGSDWQKRDLTDENIVRLVPDGQPRAMVFHVKGWREHCDVVWPRIDLQAGKARSWRLDA